jgi:hypothetical protein
MDELNAIGLAYVAGLFDGEGYIHYSYVPRRHWRAHDKLRFFRTSAVHMTVTNKYRPVLDYLKLAFGGGVYVSNKKRTIYKWKIGNKGTFRILSQLKPYLKVKSDPANLLLKNQALITKIGRRTPAERAQLLDLYKKMQAYTKRDASYTLSESLV